MPEPVLSGPPATQNFSADPAADYLVVVPTVADPRVLVPTARLLFQHADGLRVRFVLSVNPDRPDLAAEAVGMVRAIAAQQLPAGCSLDVVEQPGPVGFARAVNEGVSFALARYGVPGVAVALNDDVHVTAGWLSGLGAAFVAEEVTLFGDPPDENGHRPPRDAKGYGRIGIVGPTADNVAGTQAVAPPRGAPIEAVASQQRLRHGGEVRSADFLSGFCLAVRREALLDLLEPVRELVAPGCEGAGTLKVVRWSLFDERFGIGGFEDNDLCVRAELAGWRRAIAYGVWVHHLGHQTLDRAFPGQRRGLANRRAYLDKWAGHPSFSGRRLVAIFRVRLEVGNDLFLWRMALQRLAPLVDGVAVLLTGNPLDVTEAFDWAATQPQLLPEDHAMLKALSGKEASEAAAPVAAWVEAALAGAPDGPPARRCRSVRVDVWTGAWNERDERNATIEMAEQMGANWILSVDHDEVVEPRIDRAYLDRLMGHPDPAVSAWDVGWVNHWDSPRLVRQDSPWGDNGSYRSGMRGFRLWRVSRAAPRRILSGNAIGLHCGNCPDFDVLAKRVASFRFRHFGYIRYHDRARKHDRYQRLDPRPNASLTGGGYGHLVHEEGMRLSPFVPQDGVGLTMLVHSGEHADNVARHLDTLHGVVDRAVLVWTDAWDPDDPTTGPNADLLRFAELHGAEWVHRPLDDHFAEARNAGLDALRATQAGRPPLGWVWVVDPDEYLSDTFADCLALRRMAECSDTFGWLVQFENFRPGRTGEPPTLSEAIRMIRLDPDGVMRYSGRVHEGFDVALDDLRARGVPPTLRFAPFRCANPGLASDPSVLETKTRFYQRLILKELADRPHSPGAWTSLGMQLENDGFSDKALECYHRAILCAGDAFLPYREAALWHLRRGKVLLAAALDRISPSHPYHRIARDGVEFLRGYAPDQPLVGLALLGPEHVPPHADVDLPDFPPPPGFGGEVPPEGDGDTPDGAV